MSWLPKHRVLVPVDFSDASFAAVETALQLVDRPENLHLVYVLTELHPAEPGAVWGSPGERKEHATRVLSEKAPKGAAVHVLFGDPGHEIVDLSDELDTDLIVLPSHGRHGVKRVLLGSVAERVLRHATCPVLVLRRTE